MRGRLMWFLRWAMRLSSKQAPPPFPPFCSRARQVVLLWITAISLPSPPLPPFWILFICRTEVLDVIIFHYGLAVWMYYSKHNCEKLSFKVTEISGTKRLLRHDWIKFWRVGGLLWTAPTRNLAYYTNYSEGLEGPRSSMERSKQENSNAILCKFMKSRTTLWSLYVACTP